MSFNRISPETYKLNFIVRAQRFLQSSIKRARVTFSHDFLNLTANNFVHYLFLFGFFKGLILSWKVVVIKTIITSMSLLAMKYLNTCISKNVNNESNEEKTYFLVTYNVWSLNVKLKQS